MESPGINRDPPGIPQGSERPGKGKIPTSVPSESPFSTGISPPFKPNPRMQSWDLGRIPPIQGFTAGLKPLTGVFLGWQRRSIPKILDSVPIRSSPSSSRFSFTQIHVREVQKSLEVEFSFAFRDTKTPPGQFFLPSLDFMVLSGFIT